MAGPRRDALTLPWAIARRQQPRGPSVFIRVHLWFLSFLNHSYTRPMHIDPGQGQALRQMTAPAAY